MGAHSVQAAQDTALVIWTFLPGLHGTDELYGALRDCLPDDIQAEFVNLPSSGKQDYHTLCDWLEEELPVLPKGKKRIIIGESFSGPLAIRFASRRLDEVAGIVLAATFCDTPLNPGIALLPLRPLFMVKPPRKALLHFLIGDDAGEAEVEKLQAVVQSIPSATLSKRVRTILELQELDNPSIGGLPMLILQASSDNLIPWEAQRTLEACYPDASAHWIESPHLLFQRCPQECATHLVKFAERITAVA
ncbi:MAG: alpha/beta hydrolase [Akkermansiaceae bacterium]|nr:alpha/beta hydrolase [Akkermansiaceae bacterium]